MRISDWSSDVCSSDLGHALGARPAPCVVRLSVQSRSGAPSGKYGRNGRASSTQRANDGRASRRCRNAITFSNFASIACVERKNVVEGKSGAVLVGLGCRRIIKKKNKRNSTHQNTL